MSPRLLPLLLVAFCAPALADPPQIPMPPVDAAAATTQHAAKKPAPGKDSVDLQDIRSFTAVYSLVKQAYVENVDDHDTDAGGDPRPARRPRSAQRISRPASRSTI